MNIRNKFITTIAFLLIFATVLSGCTNKLIPDAGPDITSDDTPSVETEPVEQTPEATPSEEETEGTPDEEIPEETNAPFVPSPEAEFEIPETEPESSEEEVNEADSTVVSEVPKYNQLDYPHVPYGNYGTVRSHGCGITCLAMVATYLLDDPTLTPDVLAEQFGYYNTECGSSWTLFIDSAEVLGLGEVKQVHDWTQGVEEALRNGSLVISNQVDGPFTNGGHYILLTGMTEDGKVMVHDPNGANWNSNTYMIDGFENGFKVTAVSCSSTAYWIYEPKK